MNNVLELKGSFEQRPMRKRDGGGISMNSHQTVTTAHLGYLIQRLQRIKEFWDTVNRPFNGILISVYYNKIAAKSNRISGLFKGNKSSDAIVGAKFNQDKSKHIITYYLDLNDLTESIDKLKYVVSILNTNYRGEITKNVFEDKDLVNEKIFQNAKVKMSAFKQIIADVSYIEDFKVDELSAELKQSIITLYDVKKDTQTLLKELGIDLLNSRKLDNQTIYLDEIQMKILFEKAPYLISMATVDFSKLPVDDFINQYQSNLIHIPAPTIEPIIGVIDTLFDKNVYFSQWVEYHDMLSDDLPKASNDYRHGTAVSSIIVDGATLNPWLNDGCGRFRVRHFGVATASEFSSFSIIKQIKNIIADNRDIKVWNISLGSNQEVNDNFISAEASILDDLQFEYKDIIFVVAGTNKPTPDIEKIGSPADSINSLIVNSVTKKDIAPQYARKGLVLSFFAKPDVSYYGGSEEEYMRVCEPLGEAKVAGTSFAAPWIARKLAYLMHILGLNRELAKAMIIDAARFHAENDWKEQPSIEEIALYGHGIVPIHINEIIQTSEDEIKFLVSGVSEKWNTYNYRFPVPMENDKYPYIARATMCFFPKCSRTQGVDYTNTEFDLHFGRVKHDKNNQPIIYDIGDNKQNNNDSSVYMFESEARKIFRKWDNVKYRADSNLNLNSKRSKKIFVKDNKNWGIEIKTTERLNNNDGVEVRFGVVVTLKEINGKNRIDEFIQNCHLNGWLVNEIKVQNRIDIHQKLNEELEFEF